MSMFPSFKLPQLLRKSSPRSEICEDVPRLKCSELPVKQGIGQGFFGDINYRYFEGISDGDSVSSSFKHTSRRLVGTVGVCSDPIDFSLFTNALNLEFV